MKTSTEPSEPKRLRSVMQKTRDILSAHKQGKITAAEAVEAIQQLRESSGPSEASINKSAA